MVKPKNLLKKLRTISYWAIIALGLYIIPRSYHEWRATEEKLKQISRGAEIEGFNTERRLKASEENTAQWLIEHSDNNPNKTFCPPASNRMFWDMQTKPQKLGPYEAFTIEKAKPLDIITEGTRQECFYNTGEWLPSIEKALEEILNQDWGKPNKHGQQYVDLFATHTARELSHSLAMLQDQLPPGLVIQVKKEIKKRILDPYRKELKRYQLAPGYYGSSQCPWLGEYIDTNWIAVCIANILYCSMVVDSPEEQAHLITESKEPIEDYLSTFEEDGSIAAGIRYWEYGLKHLLLIAELIELKTDGNISLYKNPKLKDMVVYPFNTLVGKNSNQDFEFYPLFADNKNPVKTDEWVWAIIKDRFALDEGHPLLDRYFSPENQYGAALDLLMYRTSKKEKDTLIPVNLNKETSHFYASDGTLISRFNNGDEVVALVGGNNGTEHNHNDIGSYTFFSKNNVNYWLPVFGDMGDIEYGYLNFTRERRYTMPIYSSYAHPVPSINNQLQFASKKAQGKVVSHKISKEEDSVTYDLTDAYALKGLNNLTREATILKEGKDALIIKDTFTASAPVSFETAIIAAIKPKEATYNEKLNAQLIEFEITGERFLATVYNSNELNINIEEIASGNFSYQTSTTIKSNPYRISLTLKDKKREGTISYKLEKLKAENKPIEYKAIPPRPTLIPQKKT